MNNVIWLLMPDICGEAHSAMLVLHVYIARPNDCTAWLVYGASLFINVQV